MGAAVVGAGAGADGGVATVTPGAQCAVPVTGPPVVALGPVLHAEAGPGREVADAVVGAVGVLLQPHPEARDQGSGALSLIPPVTPNHTTTTASVPPDLSALVAGQVQRDLASPLVIDGADEGQVRQVPI